MKGGGRGPEDRSRLCWHANHAFRPQRWPTPEPRRWGSELVDVVYITAFRRCIDAVGGQIESQILGIHARIIEGRDCGLQLREGFTRCACGWQSQQDQRLPM